MEDHLPAGTGPVEVFWGELAASEHLVQLYELEGAFLDSLEGFVVAGLEAGECVVLIMTREHRAGLEGRLKARGIDVDALFASGCHQLYDAEETLGRFMRAGWPDDELFAATISEILRAARQNGNRVRAFGEMVAVLWARGDSAATVRLEHLWHACVQREGFALFCAYPKAGFTNETAESIRQICDAHSRIVQ